MNPTGISMKDNVFQVMNPYDVKLKLFNSLQKCPLCKEQLKSSLHTHLEVTHYKAGVGYLLSKFQEKYEEIKKVSDELFVINYWLVTRGKSVPPLPRQKEKYAEMYFNLKKIGEAILSSENI